MIKEQKYILDKILKIIDEEKADSVIIAGDVYDKSIPPSEAVTLFDEFLTKLSDRKINTYIISGNHDSAERISFGSKIMSMGGIYLSEVFKGDIKPYEMNDSYGKVNIYLVPFIKPVNVNSIYENADTENYTQAMKYVIDRMNIDISQRNIIVAHQNVPGASLSGSETSVTIGGLDNVDSQVFSCFDYTALGHIHSAQDIVKNKVRYCGTPLKYSFSEINSEKSVTIVEIKEKGNLTIKEVPIIPEHDMREVKGKFKDLIRDCNNISYDYIYISLTDENDIPNAVDRLRNIYPNIMELRYENLRTGKNSAALAGEKLKMKSPYEIFGDLYRKQNNSDLSEEQKKYLQEKINEIWGESE